jgi:CBS domain-containing protein
MKCSEVMRRRVHRIAEIDTVEVAAQILRDENIAFLPVCDVSGRLVGTLTKRNIAQRVVAEGTSLGTHVGAVMTRDFVTCSPSAELIRAEELMEKEHKRRIVCTDEGQHVLGVINRSDDREAPAVAPVTHPQS